MSRRHGSLWKMRTTFRMLPQPLLRSATRPKWVAWLLAGNPAFTATLASANLLMAVVTPKTWLASWLLVLIGLPQKAGKAFFWSLGSAALFGWSVWNLTQAAGHQGPFLILMLFAIPPAVDYTCGAVHEEYLTWRNWCEFKRRAPMTWATVSGIAKEVQGSLADNDQVNSRPNLNHPATVVFPRISGRKVFARTTTIEGRNFSQYEEVLDEWAAQMPPVRHMRLVRRDDYSTFGELQIEFGDPLTDGLGVWPGENSVNGSGATGSSTASISQTGPRSTQGSPQGQFAGDSKNTPSTPDQPGGSGTQTNGSPPSRISGGAGSQKPKQSKPQQSWKPRPWQTSRATASTVASGSNHSKPMSPEGARE